MNFNEQQLEAINHIDGPCAVIAGAGAGKSTVLVNRIANLVENGVYENQIMAITFTKKSAEDLKVKLNKLGLLNVIVGTFHSVLGRMLYRQGKNIFNSVPQFEVKKAFNTINYKHDIEDIMSFISYQKCFLKGPHDNFVAKESAYTDEELSVYYEKYEELKKSRGAYDFDDWLIEAYKFLVSNPNFPKPQYLMVDEHQDSNYIQNLLIDLLCPSKNIFVVGDYRQCIYGFRGSEPRYFMNFSKKYPNAKIINLSYNYRSCSNIVNNSNNFIKNYYGGYEYYAPSIPNNKENGEITFEKYETAYDEGEDVANSILNLVQNGVNPKNIAVLFRNHAFIAETEVALMKRKVPYHIENEGNFFLSKQILPIISMLRLSIDRYDDEALLQLIQCRCHPFTYFSKKSVGEMEMMAASNNCSYVEALSMIVLNYNQQRSVDDFLTILGSIERQAHSGLELKKLIDHIVSLLQIKDFIEFNYSSPEERKNRLISIETLKSFTGGYDTKGFLDFVKSGKSVQKKEVDDAVQLMTIHKSKGLEFDHVFVVGLQDKKFPSEKASLEEEARLFYVAVTRPIKNLYISQIGVYNLFTKQYFR